MGGRRKAVRLEDLPPDVAKKLMEIDEQIMDPHVTYEQLGGFLSVPLAAEHYGVSVATIRKWIRERGKL